MLVNLYPEAVVKKTMPGGKLPLHIACTWHAPDESINVLLGADRRTAKVPDDLGNLPIHSACFSGASSAVVEKLLKAYPKAVLSRTNQGSLPEEITKRLKHENRVTALALLTLCKDEVNAKRKMKHRRNLSDDYASGRKASMGVNER
jgi:ankyrin repeat protein